MSDPAGLQETNPLRQALPRTQVPEPCTVVFFGATGDLAHRKLVPALFQLARGGNLPSECAIVGFARRDWTDADLRAGYEKSLAKDGDDPEFRAVWDQFASRLFFASGTFDDPVGYHRLKEILDEIDRTHGTRGQSRVLPGGGARVLRDDHRPTGRGGPDLPLAAEEPLEPGRHREALRPRPR